MYFEGIAKIGTMNFFSFNDDVNFEYLVDSVSAKFSTIGYINLIKNLKHYNLRVKSLLTLKLFYPVVSAFIKYCPERNSPLTPSCPADRQLESCLSKDWFSPILTSHLSIYSNVCIVWNCVFFFCRFRIHCCYFFSFCFQLAQIWHLCKHLLYRVCF